MTDDENRNDKPKRGHLIGYARVSTEDQNLDLQMDALKKYGVSELDIYKDYATGKNMNRPEWQAMLKDARDGDTIVIWKLDRLSRNLIEGSTEVQRLYKRNVKIVSLDGELNFETAYGRFMFYLKLALAELEVDQIGERTRAGLKSAKARGRVGGRTRIILDDQVVEAFAWIEAGGYLSDIVKRHNAIYKRDMTEQGYWNRFVFLTDEQEEQAQAMIADIRDEALAEAAKGDRRQKRRTPARTKTAKKKG